MYMHACTSIGKKEKVNGLASLGSSVPLGVLTVNGEN